MLDQERVSAARSEVVGINMQLLKVLNLHQAKSTKEYSELLAISDRLDNTVARLDLIKTVSYEKEQAFKKVPESSFEACLINHQGERTFLLRRLGDWFVVVGDVVAELDCTCRRDALQTFVSDFC